jgi:hypothetical protein
MDSLNWVAIVGLTLMGFILGPIWYGPLLFGKIWMRIHGHDKKTPAEQKKGMEGMWKLMVSEVVSTFLMMVGLACIIRAIPQYSGIQNAFMIWLAFVLPMSVSNIIWGGDKKSDMPIKITIIVAYRLVILLVAGYVLSHF